MLNLNFLFLSILPLGSIIAIDLKSVSSQTAI